MTDQIRELVVTRLKNVSDFVLVKDMGYEFYYKRIIKPDDGASDAFNLFYKNQESPIWITYRGALTDDYSVVRTEEAIKQIQSNLNAQISSQRHYRSGTSIKCTFLLSEYQIDVQPDSDADILIFKLITNITADINVVINAKLSFNVLNGFSGTHALQLNYGILKSLSYQNRAIELNNVFILDEFTKRIIHDDRMVVNYSDLSNVQNQIQNRINAFKQTPVTDNFLKAFFEDFPKKFIKKFMALYEPLSIEYRNFYYASYIWSALLESEKKINMEIKLRAYVLNYLIQLKKDRERIG